MKYNFFLEIYKNHLYVNLISVNYAKLNAFKFIQVIYKSIDITDIEVNLHEISVTKKSREKKTFFFFLEFQFAFICRPFFYPSLWTPSHLAVSHPSCSLIKALY